MTSVIPPHIPAPGNITPTAQAKAEAKAFESGEDLSSVVRRNKTRAMERDDARDRHIHCIAVFFLWGGGIVVFGLLLVLAWHFAAPHSVRFLADSEVSDLKSFLFSGSVGAGLTLVGKKVAKMDRDDKPSD